MNLRHLAVAALLGLSSTLAAAQNIPERVIKFGHLVQPGHAVSLGTRKFAELVAAKSGGKLTVKEFGASALGSDMQQISALQGGVQEMTAPSSTVLAALVKEMGLIDFPFSLENSQQADALLQGPVGKALLQKLSAKGLVGLDFWETGFRSITNSRKPIVDADDIKGLKIRVLGNPVFVETFSALGANPVPLPFGEVYSALETRAVDAQENPYSIILTSKFYEVQKYLSVTNHIYTPNVILVGKKFWDKLSAAEQKILQDAALEAGVYARKANRDLDVTARKELEAKGMRVNDVPKEAIAKMRDRTRPVADKFAAAFDPELVKLYRSEMQKIHGAPR